MKRYSKLTNAIMILSELLQLVIHGTTDPTKHFKVKGEIIK